MLHAVDAVLVINLATRPDKWEAMREHLRRFTPEHKIHRVEGVLGTALPGYGESPWFRGRTAGRERVCAGQAGCAMAHRRAIEHAQSQGFKSILVLEDDIVLNDDISTVFTPAFAEILKRDVPSLIYLGSHDVAGPIWQVELYENYGLYGMMGALGTYAMVFNAAAYPWLLAGLPGEEQNPWSWVAFYKASDKWLYDWFAQHGDVYGVFPSAVSTPPSVSDIAQQEVVYDNKESWMPPHCVSEGTFDRSKKWARFLRTLIVPLDCTRRWLRARLFGFRGKG